MRFDVRLLAAHLKKVGTRESLTVRYQHFNLIFHCIIHYFYYYVCLHFFIFLDWDGPSAARTYGGGSERSATQID